MTEAEGKANAAKPTVYALRYFLDGENMLCGVYSTMPRAKKAADAHYADNYKTDKPTPWAQLHGYGYWLSSMKLDAPAVVEPDWQNTVPEP